MILKGTTTYEGILNIIIKEESKKLSKKKIQPKTTVNKWRRRKSSSSEEHSAIYGSSRKSKMDSEDLGKPDNFSSEI